VIVKTKRFRTDPATDDEIEAIWDKVFAPYDFIPTTMVPYGMEKADRAVRLLKYWRGDRPVKHPPWPYAEPEQVSAQNQGYSEIPKKTAPELRTGWQPLTSASLRGTVLLRPRVNGEYVQCWFDPDWSSEVVSEEVAVLLKQGFTEYLEVPE
jgi:hypothetical protein